MFRIHSSGRGTWLGDVSQRRRELRGGIFLPNPRPGKIEEERTFREFIFSWRVPIPERKGGKKVLKIQIEILFPSWGALKTLKTARSFDCWNWKARWHIWKPFKLFCPSLGHRYEYVMTIRSALHGIHHHEFKLSNIFWKYFSRVKNEKDWNGILRLRAKSTTLVLQARNQCRARKTRWKLSVMIFQWRIRSSRADKKGTKSRESEQGLHDNAF